MRYQLLGKSGLRVSEIALGTMTFGEDWGWGASKEVSQQQFDLFAEKGGTFIDTACNYTNGTSEKYVGDFIQADREHFVVATKYTLTTPESLKPNSGGNSRKNMRQTVEQSLKNLQTDYIDLLYLHMWDHMTPIDEVLRGVDDLVRQGKVLYFAFSDTPSWIVSQAVTRAEMMGWTRPIGLQLPYSLSSRDAERSEIPMAQANDITILPWGVLGQGVLLGKYSPDSTEETRFEKDGMNLREQTLAIIDAVAKIADDTGHSKAQVCMNWVMQQSNRAQMIPIIGARTLSQLEDSLGSIDWKLTDEQVQHLNEVSDIRYGFPRDFLEGGARSYIFGSTFDLIDNHRGNPVR